MYEALSRNQTNIDGSVQLSTGIILESGHLICFTVNDFQTHVRNAGKRLEIATNYKVILFPRSKHKAFGHVFFMF